MSDLWLKAAFLLGIVAQIGIRSPYNRLRRQNRVTTDRVTTQGKKTSYMAQPQRVLPRLGRQF